MDAPAHAPEQPDLLGSDPVQAPAQDTALIAGFQGAVLDAVVLDSDRKVRLQVLIDQRLAHHPQALPVLAVWQLPDQTDYWSTRQWADSLCRRLLESRGATALAGGIETGHHHKQPVLRLLHVRGITPAITATQTHTETAPA